MSLSSIRQGLNIHKYYSTLIFLHNLTQSQNIDGYDDSDYDNNNNNVMNHLDIAEGLKDTLVSHGFNLESLLIMQPHDLSEMLGIDEYVAKIILSAAYDIKNKS